MTSHPTTIADLVERTHRALQKGCAILFLGAGASMEGKGPSGRELTEKVRNEFRDVPFRSPNDFLEVCQDVVDTPPYTLDSLRDCVLTHLSGLTPPQTHFRAARLPWAAIFTTNYDDLIERAFDHRDCPRKIEPVFLEDRTLRFPTHAVVPYHKLMGCVRRRANEPGEMVLTRAQYNRLSPDRNRSLSFLYDALKNGVLIFAGYGFGDRLAFDAIDQLIDQYKIDNIPYSYCLGPNPPSDPRGMNLLSRRRIIPVEGTFSELMGVLWERVRAEPYTKSVGAAETETILLRDASSPLFYSPIVGRRLKRGSAVRG